jgi:hypothetical protein
MPIEIRHILFTPGEVVEAASLFSNQRGQPIPSGTVTEAAPLESIAGDAIRFRFTVEMDKAEGGDRSVRFRTFDFIGSDLAALLLNYCKRRGIPIPMKGSKSLQRFGSKVGLIVSLNGNSDELLGKAKS